MATKAQLKQRCKELDDQCTSYDVLLKDAACKIEELENKLARAKAAENEFWHSYQNEQRRAQFYYRCLSKIRHVLALDTIEQLTHRNRNDKLRTLIGTIAMWLNSTNYAQEVDDDIPF